MLSVPLTQKASPFQGRAATQNALAEAKASLGVAKPLVHSEFGYGLDRPGHCVLDTALRGVNGALHGAFMSRESSRGSTRKRPSRR